MTARFALTGALLSLLSVASAQSSVLFCMDGDEITLDNASGLVEAGLIKQDEVAVVTPAAGPVSASPFLSYDAQWTYIGDLDGDGTFVDSSSDGPAGDTDAVFVKRAVGAPVGAVTPRDVYVSKESETNLTAGFEDSDVYRYDASGSIELFLTEAQLETAAGSVGSNDLNALCQSQDGDLFLSFSDFTPPVGTDGSILFIPASAITYDGNGNVSSIAPSSMVEIATETDMTDFMFASGMLTSVGGSPSTSSFDVSALEIDPNGGTWVSQVDGQVYPNLLFAWQGFSNDGAILSTAGGGSIPTLNGVPMASTEATTGQQIGLLPDTSGLGGMMGLAVVDEIPPPLVLENYPTSLITTSTILFTRQEVSGATPGAPLVFFADIVSNAPGFAAPVIPLPGLGGQLFGDLTGLIPLGTPVADGGGYASVATNLPPSVSGSDLYILFQVYDTAAGAMGTPSAIDFL